MKKALITGITGQDGSYLAELLLEKEYKVYGLVRRQSKPSFENIKHLLNKNKITLIEGDLLDQASLMSAMRSVNPDEIYNLASQSFVATSWIQPEYSCNATGLGALRVFEAARQVCPEARIYQASSSEMFGNAPAPQNEKTPLTPRSPYGAAKAFAHQLAHVYRESYSMYISCGILYNHESPRRGLEFVTRKITHGIAQIAAGKQKKIFLGNIEAKRDWGYAPDYVEAMWRMLQQNKPDDFVIATGETHSVNEFFELAASYAWAKYHIASLEGCLEIDEALYRPAEVYELRGNYSKAKKVLGWEPKTSFEELVKIMVDEDIKKEVIWLNK